MGNICIPNRINEGSSIRAARNGLLLVFPLIIIGSFAMFLQNIYVAQYESFMAGMFGGNWKTLLQYVYDISFGIVSAALTVTVSYNLAAEKAQYESFFPILPSIVALMCYLALSYDATATEVNFFMTSESLFRAIIAGIFSTKLFIYLFKLLKSKIKFFTLDANQILSQVVLSIIPAVITVFLFCLPGFLGIKPGYNDIAGIFAFWLKSIFEGTGDLFAYLVTYVVIVHLLWFFGIHGNMMLGPILIDTINAIPAQQIKVIDNGSGLFSAGDLTKTFIDVYVFIGGVGSTLCLLIAIFIAVKRTSTIKLAKLSILPAVININEILIFGVPVIINPIFFIPFLLCPVIMLILSYLAVISGFLPAVSQPVYWTTPPLYNSYLASGSIRGPVIQLLCIMTGTVLYLPFVKLYEKTLADRLNNTYRILQRMIEEKKYGVNFSLLMRNDSIGYLAFLLSREIREAVKNNALMLEYQPLVSDDLTVIGFEALLRWPHERFGRIPPLVAIAIAEEAGCINELGRWVIRNACRQLAMWNSGGLGNICLSINISPTQLKDPALPDFLAECFNESGISVADIELEITENVVMDLDAVTKENIGRIKALGVKLAMDDFGMGYTSLLYIRHCNIDRIKIDGSITRDILRDKNCQDIISSMVYLCKSMNIKVIAEFVEDARQYSLLKELGCSEYQGYLFSPPIPPDEVPRFVRERIPEKSNF